MTLVLNLPTDLENALSVEAARLQLPLPVCAMRVLASCRLDDAGPKTGEELVAYWQTQGVIGSRPDITDPAEYASNLRHWLKTV